MSERGLDGLLHLPPPRSATEALAALKSVAAVFRERGDSRAIFPDLYGIITERVALELGEPRGLFWEPTFISRLAGRFAERYLETLAWSLSDRPQDCQAWEVAYRHKDDVRIFPFQHAALGISAHINFDLAQGIYQTIVEVGASKNTRMIRRFKHDHDQVNLLLAESFPPALRTLTSVYRCQFSALLARLSVDWSTRVAVGVLARWRDEVWENVLALLNTRGERARREVIHRMNQRAGMTGQWLALTAFNKVLARLSHRGAGAAFAPSWGDPLF